MRTCPLAPAVGARLGPRRASGRGFTLLEMLIALTVFAVLGLMSTQLVGQMSDIGANTRRVGDELVALQRAADILRRDIQQLAHRPVRDAMGDGGAAVAINHGGALLELTRRGWANPLGERRSELQRVAYALRPEGLVRTFWPVLDRAEDTEPVEQLLLAEATAVAVGGIDEFGEEHGYWPPSDDGEARELAAIVVRIDVPRHGEIERLWVVPQPALADPEPAEDDDEDGDDDAGDDGGDEQDDGAPADVDRLA